MKLCGNYYLGWICKAKHIFNSLKIVIFCEHRSAPIVLRELTEELTWKKWLFHSQIHFIIVCLISKRGGNKRCLIKRISILRGGRSLISSSAIQVPRLTSGIWCRENVLSFKTFKLIIPKPWSSSSCCLSNQGISTAVLMETILPS